MEQAVLIACTMNAVRSPMAAAMMRHLAGRGIRVGMLYADASNEAAVGLYTSLGFSVDHIDRSYGLANPDPVS